MSLRPRVPRNEPSHHLLFQNILCGLVDEPCIHDIRWLIWSHKLYTTTHAANSTQQTRGACTPTRSRIDIGSGALRLNFPGYTGVNLRRSATCSLNDTSDLVGKQKKPSTLLLGGQIDFFTSPSFLVSFCIGSQPVYVAKAVVQKLVSCSLDVFLPSFFHLFFLPQVRH